MDWLVWCARGLAVFGVSMDFVVLGVSVDWIEVSISVSWVVKDVTVTAWLRVSGWTH